MSEVRRGVEDDRRHAPKHTEGANTTEQTAHIILGAEDGGQRLHTST